MDHEEIVRLHGPWLGRTPEDAVDLMRGYPGKWWVAGGWAIEAFTRALRANGDIDLSIPRSDVSLLRRHLVGELDIWAADQGTLTPLIQEGTALASTCSNLWLRAHGAAPWEYDVILMGAAAGRWTYKRDSRISRPHADILWQRDGISYLRPEVQLLDKAPGLRSQDQQDFDPASTHVPRSLSDQHPSPDIAMDAAAQPGRPVLARDETDGMNASTNDPAISPDATTSIQPLRDEDTSIEPDPTIDPAQAEWDRTTALDEGADPEDLDPVTVTGADPAELAGDDDQIPASDIRTKAEQPDTQGGNPIEAELGEDGQGDLAPGGL